MGNLFGTPTLRDIFLRKYPQCKNMKVEEVNDRAITVTREVSGVTMKLTFYINRWGNTKEYKCLGRTDFFVAGVYNGTEEQQRSGINKGTGNFTRFVRDIIGNGSLYVRSATPYWEKTFAVVREWENDGIIEVKNQQPMRTPPMGTSTYGAGLKL